MGVDISQMPDLLLTTLANRAKNFFEVMWDTPDLVFCRIYTEHRRKIAGGTSLKRHVMLDRVGRAKYRQMFDTDTPAVDNTLHEIDVHWSQLGTSYSWDELELLQNIASPEGIIDLVESRRLEKMWDYAELLEDRGWLPPISATDGLNPFGIPYYLPYANNGATAAGFIGQMIRYQGGTNGTICAGIDAAVEDKWRSYCGFYTRVDNGLLRTLRAAIHRTIFRPAPNVPVQGSNGVGSPCELYANNDVVTEMEDLGDKRDDASAPKDLAGKMLHNMDGVVFFNRRPVRYVSRMDGETVVDSNGAAFSPDSIICVDWSKIQPITREGYWMKESKPVSGGISQHTTLTVFLDGSHANLCTNRRAAGFRIHKAIP